MRRGISTTLLTFAFATRAALAIDITIPPNMTSITVTFQNSDPNDPNHILPTATDFDVIQDNALADYNWIKGGNGGPAFPLTHPGNEVPIEGAGFLGITYDGGPGIP